MCFQKWRCRWRLVRCDIYLPLSMSWWRLICGLDFGSVTHAAACGNLSFWWWVCPPWTIWQERNSKLFQNANEVLVLRFVEVQLRGKSRLPDSRIYPINWMPMQALNNGAVMAGRLLEGNVFLVLKHEPIASLKFQINPNHDGNQPPLQDKQGLEQQPN